MVVQKTVFNHVQLFFKLVNLKHSKSVRILTRFRHLYLFLPFHHWIVCQPVLLLLLLLLLLELLLLLVLLL